MVFILPALITLCFALLGVHAQRCPNVGLRFGGAGHSHGAQAPPLEPVWYHLQSFTLEVWTYPLAGNSPDTHVMGPVDVASASGAGLVMASETTLEFVLFDATSQRTSISVELSLNDWSHVAATFDGSTAKLFMNGVESGSTGNLGAIDYSSAPLFWIGGKGTVSSAWQGAADEARMWSYPRSPTQLATTRGEWISPSETGLLAYYAMNEADSVDLFDSTANARHGTITAGSNLAWVITCESCPANTNTWCTPLPLQQLRSELPPMADLQPDFPRIVTSMQTQVTNFEAGSCAVQEGCVGGTGQRKVIRFDTGSANNGAADLVMGRPAQHPDLFSYDDCHGHYHFEQFATYIVFDQQGVERSVGRKMAYCLMDSNPMSQTYTGGATSISEGVHSCSFQGISAGWEDVYPRYIDCQWIDVTTLAPGEYTMYVEMNQRDGTTHHLQEEDYINNGQYVPFMVPEVCQDSVEMAFAQGAGGSFVDPEDAANAAITFTELPDMGDDEFREVQLPSDFTLKHQCQPVSSLYMVSNGLVTIDLPDYFTPPAGTPNEPLNPNSLSCLWRDWNPAEEGSAALFWHIAPSSTGSGKREVCFTWKNVFEYGEDASTGATPTSFQCCFHESSSQVSFRFPGTPPPVDGRVGISGPSADAEYAPRPLPGTSLLGGAGVGGENVAPVVNLSGTVFEGAVGSPIGLDASNSYDESNLALETTWYFADGAEPITAPTASHSFQSAGNHTVRVTVREVGLVVLQTERSFTVTVVDGGVCGNGICETASYGEDTCTCPSDCPQTPCHCYPLPKYTVQSLSALTPAADSGSTSSPSTASNGHPSESVWSQPAGDGVVELAAGDDGMAVLEMPNWSFQFFCDYQMNLFVNGNGFISYLAASGVETASPQDLYPLPWPGSISGLWMDLNADAGGRIVAHSAGSAPHRQRCVSWLDVPPYLEAELTPEQAAVAGLTFQICLYESGDIAVRYQDVETVEEGLSEGGSATIGLSGLVAGEEVVHSSMDYSVYSSTYLMFRRNNAVQTRSSGQVDPTSTAPNTAAPGSTNTATSDPATTDPGTTTTTTTTTSAGSTTQSTATGQPSSTPASTTTAPSTTSAPTTQDGVCDITPYQEVEVVTGQGSTIPEGWVSPIGHAPLRLLDDGITSVPLPFAVDYFCTSFNLINVAANGFATFTAGASGAETGAAAAALEVVAGCWTDLDPSAGGSVLTGLVGTAPRRQFVLTWQGVPEWGNSSGSGGNTATFQIAIEELSSDVILRYRSLPPSGCPATGLLGGQQGQSRLFHPMEGGMFRFRHTSSSPGGSGSGSSGSSGSSGGDGAALGPAVVLPPGVVACGDQLCSAEEDSCSCPTDCGAGGDGSCPVCSVTPYYYAASVPSFAVDALYIDPLLNGHTQLQLGDDGSVRVNLPDPFTFFCQDYVSAYVSANGFLSFNPQSAAAASPGSTASPLVDMIAVLAMDLGPSSPGSGSVFWGAAADMAVATWVGVRPWGAPSSSDGLTFQLQLRSDMSITLVYMDTVMVDLPGQSEGRGASVGVVGKDSSQALSFPAEGETIRSGTAYRLTSADSAVVGA